jgi:hypothetical protein
MTIKTTPNTCGRNLCGSLRGVIRPRTNKGMTMQTAIIAKKLVVKTSTQK